MQRIKTLIQLKLIVENTDDFSKDDFVELLDCFIEDEYETLNNRTYGMYV